RSAPSRVALRTGREAFAVLSDLWRSAGAVDRSTRMTDTPFGVLRHVAAPAKLSKTPAYLRPFRPGRSESASPTGRRERPSAGVARWSPNRKVRDDPAPTLRWVVWISGNLP